MDGPCVVKRNETVQRNALLRVLVGPKLSNTLVLSHFAEATILGLSILAEACTVGNCGLRDIAVILATCARFLVFNLI